MGIHKISHNQISDRRCTSFLVMKAIICQIKRRNTNLLGRPIAYCYDCGFIWSTISRWTLKSCSSFTIVKEVFPHKIALTEDQVNMSGRSREYGDHWKKSGRCEDFSRAGLTPPYCVWPDCLSSPGSLDKEPRGQTQMWVTQRMEAARGHHLRAVTHWETTDSQRLNWLKIQSETRGVMRQPWWSCPFFFVHLSSLKF